MEYKTFYVLFMSINLGFIFVTMLAACLCCRRKIPKNEFLGLEGMVKIKNPEENTEQTQPIESNPSTTGDIDLKRASNAPHRSLPDIPVVESLNDNGSELYATVADKVHEKPQGGSPTPSLKKQTSVSQHSSISQADDVSSPYARVKTPPHDYDKVLSTEHPYAQLSTPGQNVSVTNNNENTENNQVSRRGSNQSLFNQLEIQQQEIPAASAIAGMVSASQELPYMTPPIIQQPHFSGDSQDSSKGYTSISVREPLANILAQTNRPPQARLLKDGNDPHYATVSDDSDEMYAAIDDPNNVYTSGSETYAQIQPANAITVSVEINTATSRIPEQNEQSHVYETSKPKPIADTPIPPPVDSLRAQMHSRQASSSSNTSSVGILGSPKPEKRQANSPLPPTPKNSQFISNTNLTSSSSIPSGRNSVASVIECQLPASGSVQSKENVSAETNDNSSSKKNFSPSKDIEGMYAKVMKKNKFSNTSSQNSPVMGRKLSVETNSPDMMLLTSDLSMKEYVLTAIQASPGENSVKSASYLDKTYETMDKRRPRCNSYDNKDHGYETIPGDKNVNNINNNFVGNRRSDGYTQIMQKERLEEEYPLCNINFDVNKSTELFMPKTQKDDVTSSSEPGYESLPGQLVTDPGYETLLKTVNDGKEMKQTLAATTNSDYDPNYEVLRPSAAYSGSSDDGYARVVEKMAVCDNDDDMIDGYSRVKERYDENMPGYSRIKERNYPNDNNDSGNDAIKNHDYASILEAKNRNKDDHLQQQQQYQQTVNDSGKTNLNNNDEIGSDIYSSIPNEVNFQNLAFTEEFHSYQTIYDVKSSTATIPTPSNISACSTKSSEKLTTATTATTTPSTGQSSPDSHHPHKYHNMKYSSTSNTLSSSIQQYSSNYESLTGSESDPNYESVRYLNAIENPYERLHNDTTLSPDITSSVDKVIKTSSSLNDDLTKITATHSSPKTNQPHKNSNENNGEVSDYFQV